MTAAARPAAVRSLDVALSAALAYHRRGWSVIPLLRRDKRPVISWERYQHERPMEDDIRRWWREDAQRNVAIVTGPISGLLVLDVDGPEGRESLRGLHLPATITATTGRGAHYYFRHPGGRVPNAVHILPGVDLRADGGYAVAPPSVHPSGRRYEWVPGLAPDDVELAPCPDWLLERLRPQARQGLSRTPEDWRRLVLEGAAEGRRNNTVAALAGHLLRRGVDPWVVLGLLLGWNESRCRPPLPSAEVARTVDSVARLEARRRGVACRGS